MFSAIRSESLGHFLHEVAIQYKENTALIETKRKAEVARLRGLAELSIAETAAKLAVSEATVERDWSFARAWLSREVEQLRSVDSPDS